MFPLFRPDSLALGLRLVLVIGVEFLEDIQGVEFVEVVIELLETLIESRGPTGRVGGLRRDKLISLGGRSGISGGLGIVVGVDVEVSVGQTVGPKVAFWLLSGGRRVVLL